MDTTVTASVPGNAVAPIAPSDDYIASTAADFKRTVVTCYSVMDRFFPAVGLLDLTEGIYHGDPSLPMEHAQANQHEYLLDQAQVGPGSRLLDIGCGYGTLVRRANGRGAKGRGITITPEQVERCRAQGLDVRLVDYKVYPSDWDGSFDAITANGSMEHFLRPEEVAAGRGDEVYRALFATVHRLIDPASASRRFVTTTIHFTRPPSDPLAALKSPLRFPWGSDAFHWSVLERGWGGYYPEMGQLQRAAEGYFDLVEEVDGTEDYLITSDEWVRRVQRALLSPKVFTLLWNGLPAFVRSPVQFITLLLGSLWSQSWNWQFRGPNPPTRLLRQTWVYRPR